MSDDKILMIRAADPEPKIEPPPGFRSPGDDPDVYGLILRFDSDEPEFTRGFEAGMLWRDLDALAEGRSMSATIHDTNAVMVQRMAEARGCSYRIVDAPDGGWLVVEFRKLEES